jgi:hypothetical protein
MKSVRITITIFFLLSLIGCFTIPTVFSSTEGDNIIITEVLYDTPGTDADEEWIELFNPTKKDIDIANWTIEDNVDSFKILSGIVPSGGYFVIARLTLGFNALYGSNPDLEGLTLFLGNSGDKLILRDTENTGVDLVAWEEEVPGWTVNATHTTIRRIGTEDTDTVNDWEDSGTLGDPGAGVYTKIKANSPITAFVLLMTLVSIVGLNYLSRKNR